jgi:anti-anti-sigma factor
MIRIETEKLFDERIVRECFEQVSVAIGPQHHIILDLEPTTLWSSTALRKLVDLEIMSRKRGGRMILCGLTPVALQVFRTSNLDRLFQIVSTIDEAMTALGWSLAIRRPIAACEGDGVSYDPSIIDRGEDFCCRSCGCRFRVAPLQLDSAGEARVAVSSFEIPTYELERVRVVVGAISHLEIVGRLDLFAAEALVDAWRSLPRPRQALLGLSAATELSELGLRLIEEHVRGDTSIDRVVVQVDPAQADRTRAVLSDVQVMTKKDEAMLVLRGSPESDEIPLPLLVVARPVGRTAEPTQSREAGTLAGEHGSVKQGRGSS